MPGRIEHEDRENLN